MNVRAADLALVAFPVGAVTRTAVGKIDIILYRVECWRSFADYALGVLAESAENASL
jgi:sarcosine oxidase subunit gamma